MEARNEKMNAALKYIESEVYLQNILIARYYEEVEKSDNTVSRTFWKTKIDAAKSEILQLENVKHLLTS